MAPHARAVVALKSVIDKSAEVLVRKPDEVVDLVGGREDISGKFL